NKAKELVGKLNSYSGELLGAIEKQDAEELNMLQKNHESIILEMTTSIKQAQIVEAEYNIQSLQDSLNSTNQQLTHYTNLIDEGLLPIEEAQIALMIISSILNKTAAGVKIGASFSHGIPQFTVGPFSFGSTMGGEQAAKAIDMLSQAIEASGMAISSTAEVLGIYAQHKRSKQDWKLQKIIAQNDVLQIEAQIEGAKLGEKIAQRDLEIHLKQIEQGETITTFMKNKFTNKQLYQWMVSKLSSIYFQTYQMAYDISKAAEKAFQFERGFSQSEINYINQGYWDSQRKGLLAGSLLELDLHRMEKAYYQNHSRDFEITKNISLLEHDPIAFLNLKRQKICQFNLKETDFDYDYPGHYARQIKTVSLTFKAGEGQIVNAVLTQLTHKTVLQPDLKAVKYLIE
ncbi:MAG: hypothetical protein AAFR37_19705, partial [Cyanobacteria bacterium J06628_3]